jgi:hypothetical protein
MSQQPIDDFPALSLRDITEILVKSYKLHEGRFETALSFDIGVATMATPVSAIPVPTIMTSVVAMQLRRVPDDIELRPDMVDAAQANPA